MKNILVIVLENNSVFFQLTINGVVQYQQYTLKPTIYTEIVDRKGTEIDHKKFASIFAPNDPIILKTIYEEAVLNPTRLYTIYDTSSSIFGFVQPPLNMKFLYATQNQPSAVAGYFCYQVQKSFPQIYGTQVGVLFGQLGILALDDFYVGFRFGYSYEDPDAAQNVILCEHDTTFTDNQVSYDVTKTFLEQYPEIKISLPLNGAAYLGSYNAIYEKQQFAIGVDADYFNYIYSFNPSLAYIVLASITKYMNELLFKYLNTCPSIGTTVENTSYDMKDGVVDFITSPFMVGDKYPLDIREKVDTFKRAIEDGSIIVPSAFT